MTSNHALLLSIRPQYVASIFAETKRVELRRVKPRLKSGDLVIIYESEATKGIVGAFTVKGVTTAKPENIWRKHKEESGVTKQQFDAYLDGVEVGYAIQIGSVRRLPDPILLSTIRERREGFRPPQSYHYLSKPDVMSLSDGELSFMPFDTTKAVQHGSLFSS